MIIIDGNNMKTKTEAHKYLKKILQLPDYYGNNLDALYDCLTEMDEMTVCFRNICYGTYGKKVWKVFRQAEKENSCIQIYTEE